MNLERLALVQHLALAKGSHARPMGDPVDGALCVMEAVAYVAGEPWSDTPACACPVLGAFMRRWNDDLPTDADRARLLGPLIPRLVGSKSTPAVEERRAYLALDWMIRTYTPTMLDPVLSLASHAIALRALPEIIDLTTAHAVSDTLKAAGAAAWDAAWAAAGGAAWDAAGDAARDAAGAAAWDAARAAARAAAWAAAWDAARAAAWAAAGGAAWDAARDAAGAAAGAAARAAAWDAARDALAPTVAKLQASALDLVERMLAVGGA